MDAQHLFFFLLPNRKEIVPFREIARSALHCISLATGLPKTISTPFSFACGRSRVVFFFPKPGYFLHGPVGLSLSVSSKVFKP
jgi:hypothetical protein